MQNGYFRTIFLFILVLQASFAWAHRGSITGTIYDAVTHQPLIGASVQIKALKTGTTTDELGKYAFRNIETGNYTLSIHYIGYQPFEEQIEVKENQTSTAQTKLAAAPIELKEAIVTSKQVSLLTLHSIDLKVRPYNSSQDLLRIVPGLFIAQHAGGGKAEQLFLRGFDLDHGTDVKISTDGMPVNMVSHAHGQGYADLHYLIPETVEGIDFDKGPYNAASGNFATAGTINFLTKRSIDSSRVKLEAGMYNTMRALTMLNLLGEKAKASHQHAYIASEYYFTNGFVESPQRFHRYNIFGKYNALLGKNTVVNLSVSTFSSRWNASGQVPLRAIEQGLINRYGSLDNTEGGQTSRSNANVLLTHVLPDNAIIKQQVYYTRYAFSLFSNFTFFLRDSVNGDEIHQYENRNLAGYNGSYTKTWWLNDLKMQTEAGAGIRYDQVQNIGLSPVKARQNTNGPFALGNIKEQNNSVYIRNTINVTEQLTLSTSLRYDQLQFRYTDKVGPTPVTGRQAKGIASPKASLQYFVNNTVQLYAHAGTGFHSNDARVVVAQQGRQILPRAIGYEAGTIWKPLPGMLLNVGLWRLFLEQEFVYVGDEGVVEPSGKTNRVGIDASVRYQLSRQLFADLDLNLAKPRALNAPEGEKYIPLAPLFTSIGGLTYKQAKGLSTSLRYRYMANRPANETYTAVAQGYLLLDFAGAYTFKRFEFGLTVENLLNRNWREAQFNTESRLQNEPKPVTEIHYTPGTPFNLRTNISFWL